MTKHDITSELNEKNSQTQLFSFSQITTLVQDDVSVNRQRSYMKLQQQCQKTLHQHWTTYCPESCTFRHWCQKIINIILDSSNVLSSSYPPMLHVILRPLQGLNPPAVSLKLHEHAVNAHNKQRWDKNNVLKVISKSQVLVFKVLSAKQQISSQVQADWPALFHDRWVHSKTKGYSLSHESN